MKTIHIFYSLALVSLLCACSAEQDAADAIPSTDPQPVTVAQVSIVGEVGNVGDAPATRADVTNDTYQLGLIRAAVASYSSVWNTPYSYTSSGWTSTTPIAVVHRKATFYAYYPYHTAVGNYANLASGYEFTLSAQAYSASEDICISNAAQMVTNNAIDGSAPLISFKDMLHVYSRIRLTLTRGAANESTGTYAITNINFKNGESFITTATQNIQTRATVTNSILVNGWNHNPNITLSPGSTAQVIDLLIPPQTVNDGLSMMFTIDGHMRSATIPADKFTDNKLEAGEQYSIALKLRDVAVTMVGTVQTEDWADGAPINKDSNGYEDYVPFVILPSIGLKVAKGNLMRASGTNQWYLAPDQGYYTGAMDGEDNHPWNVPNLNAGCVSVLGLGWRIPTINEFRALSGIPCKWGRYKTQGGMRYGYYYGTNTEPDPSRQDEYAFLPAAGYRNGATDYQYPGTAGYYWTNENYPDYFAWCYQFNSSTSLGPYQFTYQHYGLSVRCVTED